MKHIEPRAVVDRTRQEADRVIKKTRNRLKKTFRTKRNRRRAIYATGAILLLSLTIQAAYAQNRAQNLNNQLNVKSVQLQQRQQKLEKLQTDLHTIQNQKAETDTQLQQKNAAEEQLKAQINDLNTQLQAKAEAKRQQSLAAAVVNTVTFTATASAQAPVAAAPVPSGPVSGCGDNEYAHFIYMHESGCQTHNPNGSGCDGIGQACPASKVIGACGYDYACQNAWFTNYASKYGGWAGSYQFWLSHGWW